jgi:hypothetical protein
MPAVRRYVVYNAKNDEYVGYGAHYGVSINVYISKSPTGPFVYRYVRQLVFQLTNAINPSFIADEAMHSTQGEPPWRTSTATSAARSGIACDRER